VDEAGVRTLLNRLADTEPPSARIDLDAAIARGRRGRRWRRVRAGVSVLLAGGAAAAVAAALLVPAPRSDQRPTGGPAAPARFNPLVPYAKFGWLPPGFQVGVRGGTMSRSGPEQLLLDAFSGSNAIIQLFVYPPGSVTSATTRCAAPTTRRSRC
jgi:anti-sigma factor RsiW